MLRRLFGEGLVALAEGGAAPYRAQNFFGGAWSAPPEHEAVPDPLTGAPMLLSPLLTTDAQRGAVVAALAACPRAGLHNPLRRPERYRLWGDVCRRSAELLREPAVEAFFLALQNRAMPKSDAETRKELLVTRRFFENFAGDVPRFALRGFCVAGDRAGGASHGLRFPFGPVGLITPFNFPLEIPCLQLAGALMAGNAVLFKPDSRGGAVAEAAVRLLLAAGAPPEAVLLVHGDAASAEALLGAARGVLRSTLFTGGHAAARRVAALLDGRVRLEDAGFNWKLLGPRPAAVPFVAAQVEQDAFACSGQKCSALRLLLAHRDWRATDLLEAVRRRAAARSFAARTLSPLLSWSNARLEAHLRAVLAVPGARLLWGGAPAAEPTRVPPQYGTLAPTAVAVPLAALAGPHAALLTREVFGPVLLVAEFADAELPAVLRLLDGLQFHLTAGVVSSDVAFLNRVLGETVSGVTYAGPRARTTGAPQNHWFGPGNDPRAAGIGTPEAVVGAWTCHREIVYDFGELGQPPEELPLT